MAEQTFTLDELEDRVRIVVREEISGVRADFMTEISGVRNDVKTEITDVRTEIKALGVRIDSVKTMLQEDYAAEVDRVDRLERRLDRTQIELRHHITDSSAHK